MISQRKQKLRMALRPWWPTKLEWRKIRSIMRGLVYKNPGAGYYEIKLKTLKRLGELN